MEVSKAPAVPPSPSPGAASTPPAASMPIAAEPLADFAAGTRSDATAGVAPAPDRVDIRDLDPQAALQILIAEVRGAFAELLTEPAATASAAPAVAVAPRAVLELFLAALPQQASDAKQWSVAAAQIEQSLQSALDRATAIVAAWRNAAPAVIAAADDARAQILTLVNGNPTTPLWLSPEWVGLRPRLETYWRRRRRARRLLSDPDYTQRPWDDEFAPPAEGQDRDEVP